MGRNGALRTPQEVMHMAEQLHGTLNIAMNNSMATLKAIDAQMGKMAAEIQEKQAQLDALNKKLGIEESPDNTAGGAVTEDPGQG
jgi:hypothetical protein